MPAQRQHVSPLRARCFLALFVLTAVLSAAVPLTSLRSGYAEGARFDAPTDVDLYNAEVERMREDTGYYEAAAAELRSRGYPTKSVFNWRLPLPLVLIAALPDGVGQAVLGMFAVLLIAGGVLHLGRQGRPAAGLLCGLLLFGALMPVFLARLYVMPVLWAGTFMGLSLVSYGLGWRRFGVACGLAALFCRELAAPYCLICACFAVGQRRWQELAAWFLGLSAYAAYFAWHVAQVLPLIRATDVAHQGGWLQFGGLPFVISLVQLNAFLLVLPQWVSGLFFAAAMAGFAWSSQRTAHPAPSANCAASVKIALTTCLYVALFAAVGHSFNQYWGAMIAPLFCFGAAQFPGALREALRASELMHLGGREGASSDGPVRDFHANRGLRGLRPRHPRH